MFDCTFCGAPTRSLYYKRQKRQTHHAPSDVLTKSHKLHTKVCTNKACGQRFSICDRHSELGWQEWHEEERHGRRDCKAVMWMHNCKGCGHSSKPDINTVLCPECKAPFTNKGAKWYLNLAKRCRHGKSRTSAWSKMEENAKTLINLGESSQAIMARLLGLTCMQLDRESSETTASDTTSDTVSDAASDKDCDTASDSASVTASDKDSDSDDAASDKASNKDSDKASDKDSDKASDKDSDSDYAPSSPDSPRDSPAEQSAEQSHYSQDLKTPKKEPLEEPSRNVRKFVNLTEDIENVSPRKRARKDSQEEYLDTDFSQLDEVMMMPGLEKEVGPYCYEGCLGADHELCWCQYSFSTGMLRL